MSRYQETLSPPELTAGSVKLSNTDQPSLCQCNSPNCIQESCWDSIEKSFQSLEKDASKKIETILEEDGPAEPYEVIHERESFEEDEAEEEEEGEGEDEFEKNDVFAKENPLTPEADPDYECIVVNEIVPLAEKQAVENLNDWRSSCLCNFKQAQDSLLDRYIKHYSETWQFSRHLQKLGNNSCTCGMQDTSNKGTVVRDFCPNYNATRDLRRCSPKKRTCAMDRRIDPTPIDFLDKSIEQFCKLAKGRVTRKDNDCVIINCSLGTQSDESQETLCACEPPPPKKEKPNIKTKAHKNVQPCPVFQAMQKSNEYPKNLLRSRVTSTSTSEMGRAKKTKRRGTNPKMRRGSMVKFGSLDEVNKKRLSRLSQKSKEKLYNRRKTPAAWLQPVGIVTRATQMSRELECQCAPEDENVWEDLEDDDGGGGDDDDDDDENDDEDEDDEEDEEDDDDNKCNADNCPNADYLPNDDDKNCPCSCGCGGDQDVDDVGEPQPTMDTKGSQTNKQKSKKKTIYIKICNGFQNAAPPPKAECQCACAPPKNTYKIQETQSERAKPTFAKSLNDKSKILSQKCCKERPLCRKSLPKVCLKKLSTSPNKCRELLAKEQSHLKSMRVNPSQIPRSGPQNDSSRDRPKLACCQSSRQSQQNPHMICTNKPYPRACGPLPSRAKSVESTKPFCNRQCCPALAQRQCHRTKATQSVDECTCVSQKDNKQVACKPDQCDNYTETCHCIGAHSPYEFGLCSSTDLKAACSLGDLESPFSLNPNCHPCVPPLRANNSDTCTPDRLCSKNCANPCCNQCETPAPSPPSRPSNGWCCRWAMMNPRVIRMNCPRHRYCIAYNHQIQYQSSFYPNTAVQVDSMELIRNEPPTKLNAESQRAEDVAIQASNSSHLASIQIISDEKSLRGDKYQQPEKDHGARSGARNRNRRNVSANASNASNTFDSVPTPPIVIASDVNSHNSNRDHVKRQKLSTPTESVEEEEEVAKGSLASVAPPKTFSAPPSRLRESKRVSMKYEFSGYPPDAGRSGTDSIEERIRILRKNLEAKHGSDSNSNRSQSTVQSFGKDPEGKASVDEQEMTSQLLSRRLTAGKVFTK